ncbi:hypothetical protein EUX55_02055 [Haemophilus haemolyticus]|uniref:Uncharacterized protein n=1 Tax=Haemophilus haemolyticus TaxID=726 RepID=A0A502JV05_HAEHA|nr:hypothetical protein EUX55_02055 [Haemophilus haemolyticus]
MVFDIRISPDGDLLFLCFAKEKVGKKKGNPAFPYFLCYIEFVSRKFSKLAALKQTKISYKFNYTKAEKKGLFLSACKILNIFIVLR